MSQFTNSKNMAKRKCGEDYIGLNTDWTRDEDVKLLQMRSEFSISYDDAASEFGRSPLAVYYRLKKLAVRQIINNGKDLLEVCTSLHLSEKKIRNAVAMWQKKQDRANKVFSKKKK